jgi:hypothetical protein
MNLPLAVLGSLTKDIARTLIFIANLLLAGLILARPIKILRAYLDIDRTDNLEHSRLCHAEDEFTT